MGKLFGTDGIRGVVGENLTADMAFRVGQAVGTVLMEDKGSRPTVVIGKDTRISSDMLESALMAGLCSVGSDVKPVGTIPTPAVAYLTVQEKADAGIVISASHNPYDTTASRSSAARATSSPTAWRPGSRRRSSPRSP
ncbi:MAG: hypothetical protein ACLUHL_11165 [Dysosmobacter welbionis]